MDILVTDANIFIDLLELEFIEHLFKIGYDVYTTREVLGELDPAQRQALENIGDLIVHDFVDDELEEISELDCPNSLSFTDRTLVYLSIQRKAIMLTGDAVMRRYAREIELDVHGILWFFDKCVELKAVPASDAASHLRKLKILNVRLPLTEVEKRIKSWEQ